MLLTLLGKCVGTAAGLTMLALGKPALWTAAVLGIAPLWLAATATLAIGHERGVEARPIWRWANTSVDALSFVLVPTVWLAWRYPPIAFDLCVFAFCGLYHLGHSQIRGIAPSQFTEGLPVSYTGYLWVAVIFGMDRGWVIPVQVGLYLVSFLMVWAHFRAAERKVD